MASDARQSPRNYDKEDSYLNQSTKNIRIVGQWRPELDLKRFADALIALALHHLRQNTTVPELSPAPELEREAS